jgi:hypothetical protein
MQQTRRHAIAVLACSALASACGGGGDSSPASAPSSASTVAYANSIAVGASAPQLIVYQPASGAVQPTVTTTEASTLLPIGTTAVLSEHVESGLEGIREVCVSGRGDTTNVVAGINLGVVMESAAVLLNAQWTPTDSNAAWNAAVAAGSAWSGWQNCGEKPEGPPSRSSRLVPTSAGGYSEDVFDGNPGTNFLAIVHNVSAMDVAAMLSTQGLRSSEDPQRPLQLFLRAFRDSTGHVVFIQSGSPASTAAASVRGFVALYIPGG